LSEPDPALYRPCVGVMLVNAAGKAFVGKRIDNKERSESVSYITSRKLQQSEWSGRN
jgi:hypothetical protein